MKRYLALLLACLMVVSLFAACSKKNEESSEAGNSAAEESKEESSKEDSEGEDSQAETSGDVIDHGIMTANGELPIVNEKMEFDVICRQVGNVTDMKTNGFVLWLEDQTNIHINYEMIPEDSISEKTNLILASGEYPDGFQYSAINTTLQVKYGAQGAFVNVAPYFEKFGYYANEAYAATTYLPKAITTPTGEIYCIAGVNECYHCFYAGRAWINKLWLDDLQKEMPQTTDELKAVLEGFRDNDMNGNGDATDEIPMIGTAYSGGAWNGYLADWLLQSYIYSDYNMLVAINPDTKTIEYQATTDEYKEGLTMIKQWIDEDLVDEESFNLTSSELETLGMGEDPRLGLFVAALWWSGVGQEQVMDANGVYRERNYTIISNVEGPNGVRHTFTNLEGIGGNFVITSACEYPEVLFRWCDYQMDTEASIRAYVGNYGVSIEEPDEGALGINEKPALYKTTGAYAHNSDANDACDNVAISKKSADVRLGQQTDWDDPEAYYDSETRLYIDSRDAQSPYDSSAYNVPTLVMGEEDANKRTELETPIRDYRREWQAKFLLGEVDLEADWDEYVSGYDGLRLQEYIDLLNQYYTTLYA